MRLRVLGDGTPGNWVVVDDRGELVEGVEAIEVTFERGKAPVGVIRIDGIGVDVLAEIRRLTNSDE